MPCLSTETHQSLSVPLSVCLSLFVCVRACSHEQKKSPSILTSVNTVLYYIFGSRRYCTVCLGQDGYCMVCLGRDGTVQYIWVKMVLYGIFGSRWYCTVYLGEDDTGRYIWVKMVQDGIFGLGRRCTVRFGQDGIVWYI